MTYETLPKNFTPKFEIASCFIEHANKIILLRRQDKKFQGGRWGLSAGKLESGEETTTAVLREVKEETGIRIAKDKVNYFGKTYHRHGDADFIFHMFSAKLESQPKVVINPYEHQAFAWKTPAEVILMARNEIVEDLDVVCKIFYKL